MYFLAKVVVTGAIAVGGYHIRGDIFSIRLCTIYPDTGVIVFLMLYIIFIVYNPLIYQQMNGHHFYTILIRGSMPDLPLTQSDYLSWLFLQLAVAWCPQLFDFNSKSTDKGGNASRSKLWKLTQNRLRNPTLECQSQFKLLAFRKKGEMG